MDDENAERLRGLERAVEQARVWVVGDDELLIRFETVLDDLDTRLLVDEIRTRLERWPAAQHHQVARALRRIITYRTAGDRADAVDRLLRRVMPRLRPAAARPVALLCAKSGRMPRRRVAYRFYRRNGFDDTAREVLMQSAARELDHEYWRAVATDGDLLARIGVTRAIDSTFDRNPRGLPMRVMRTALANGLLTERDERMHPLPLLNAIRDSGDPTFTATTLRILGRQPEDVDVVAEVLHTLAAIGAQDELRRVLPGGHDLLLRLRIAQSHGAEGEVP